MTPVLIPYCTDELFQHEELCYCIAGLRKFIPYEIYIITIGDKNPYADECILYPSDDNALNRDRNMYEKLCVGLGYVDDKFIYSADDNHLLSAFDEVPQWTQWTNSGLYKNTEDNTRAMLNTAVNYDVHYPSVMSKARFIKRFNDINWKQPYGYCIKSIYYHGSIDRRYSLDYKLRDYPVKTKDWQLWDCVSTGWKNFECVQPYLKKLYEL